ncbi:MAG: 4-(cytidine 5'-diphospho)-2-C-methyl-D-erythritol kinase [Phascolarctobacterium sp.]|nr:4-(cytidine 5'-diphospho)-2-C-methyl-D-erythritol kinase [Phascolarctobacterium sp.]MBQ7760019.1 4-(cytidine 5'-diphospho)-2-C-methyl-D-erythritol kinase [Acidaminococcaceae bacterium]
MTEKIIETAYAKINLGLRILGKRKDGYHEVSMIMQSVGLSDEVIITEGNGIEISTNVEGLSCGKDNLAYKAAALLAEKYNITPNVHIVLNKGIFMAAGLAGGSSDAAAVLRGLNKYWKLGLYTDKLEAIGAELGSDVPFCICGGSAIAKGRGEVILPLPDMPENYVVLAKPKNLDVSTAWVYKNYDPGRVLNNPCIWQIAENLPHGGRAMAPFMGNALETVTIPAHPQIALLKMAMLKAGAYFAMMSGSGPTVFAFADNREIAEAVVEAVQDFNVETAITTTVRRKDI